MLKIIQIFRSLLDSRINNAISFDFAEESSNSFAANVYWELLNQLSEHIAIYLEPLNDWSNRIIIKDTMIQIEIYNKTVGEIPWGKLVFGVTSELNSSTREQYKKSADGFYSFDIATLDSSIPQMVHIFALLDNLETVLLDFGDVIKIKGPPPPINENVNEVWRLNILD